MKKGVLIQQRYNAKGVVTKVKYTINPYDSAQGLLRVVQRYAVILLTTKGTDPIRPWFGTNFNAILQSNISSTRQTELYVRDCVSDAQTQILDFQNSEVGLNEDDKLQSVQLTNFTIDEDSHLIVTLKFTGYSKEAITVSLGG